MENEEKWKMNIASCISDNYADKVKVVMTSIIRNHPASQLRFFIFSSERPLEFPFSNKMVNPREWLARIRDAEFVLTNSFHCAVFSIIFHKPFAVLALDGRYDAQNERFYSLLSRIGLSDRLVRTEDDLMRVARICDIDWSSVDAALVTLREHSWSYLHKALGE